MTEHASHKMNPNSLANLNKGNTKSYSTYQNCLSKEKIDELFSYLAEGMSLTRSAKEANITPQTARRYFREGDAKRGIQPLVQRLSVFQERVSEKMNVLLEETRMERLKLIRDMLKKASDSMFNPITGFFDKDGNPIDVYDKNKVKIEAFDPAKFRIADIERLMKLEAFLSGGVKTKEKESSFLSADEISSGSANE